MDKIKEAFEKWFPNQVTEQELAFGIGCTVGVPAEELHSKQVAGINFHGGYTSGYSAAERGWKEKVEEIKGLLEHFRFYKQADDDLNPIIKRIDQILGR